MLPTPALGATDGLGEAKGEADGDGAGDTPGDGSMLAVGEGEIVVLGGGRLGGGRVASEPGESIKGGEVSEGALVVAVVRGLGVTRGSGADGGGVIALKLLLLHAAKV